MELKETEGCGAQTKIGAEGGPHEGMLRHAQTHTGSFRLSSFHTAENQGKK